jgi:hypothetical protein
MKSLAIVCTVMAGVGIASAFFTFTNKTPEGLTNFPAYAIGVLVGPILFTIAAAWAWGKCATKTPPENPSV